MIFRGKIGYWWWGVLLLMLKATVDTLNEMDTSSILSLIVGAMVIIVYTIAVHMTLKNYVILGDDSLTIFLGVIKKTIFYKDILSIKKTVNPLSSMAISFDRLEIRARKTSVIIAVKDKPGFVQAVIKRNSKIETTPDLL
ncbi:MAG TPA: hypothetical protein DCS67_05425 [Clostridiales bacterium UBA8960]|jgi:hypothetical protein|nr:hypothetical protein [Clostridiales bacterium UBA8960]